jgi:hypothetical protein
MISGGNLSAPRQIQTGPLGIYLFSGLDPGGEYTVNASAKRHRFGTFEQVLSSLSSVTNNVDFAATQ